MSCLFMKSTSKHSPSFLWYNSTASASAATIAIAGAPSQVSAPEMCHHDRPAHVPLTRIDLIQSNASSQVDTSSYTNSWGSFNWSRTSRRPLSYLIASSPAIRLASDGYCKIKYSYWNAVSAPRGQMGEQTVVCKKCRTSGGRKRGHLLNGITVLRTRSPTKLFIK